MSERHKKLKPAIIIGATMIGIGGTGIGIILTHYHPKHGVLEPKNPSGQVFSSSSVRGQEEDLRPTVPARAGAAENKAAPATATPAKAAPAAPDAGSPAPAKKKKKTR